MQRRTLQFGTRGIIALVALCALVVWLVAPTFRHHEPPATVDRVSEKEAMQLVSRLLQSPEQAMPITALPEPNGWCVSSDDPDRGLFQVFGRDRQGQTAIIELPERLYRGPSSYDVVVSLADKSGAILTASEFSLGWRVYEANVRTARLRGRTFVIFEENSRRQYYAFIENRPILVRWQDHQQRILRNTFGAPNLTIGPPLPERSEEEWESALESKDVAEVLRSLVWLGGSHVDPDLQPSRDSYREPLEAARLVQAVRDRPRVQQTLNRLRGSSDRWLQEAAELAAAPEYYR